MRVTLLFLHIMIVAFCLCGAKCHACLESEIFATELKYHYHWLYC